MFLFCVIIDTLIMRSRGETVMQIIKDYEIHTETMVLLPCFDHYANLHTIVIEEQNYFLVEMTPKKLIDASCRYYGSSYEGRLEGIKRVMGISKKAPIAISAELSIFFFPLESPNNHSCVWLSHSHIEEIRSSGNRNTLILFTNGQAFTVPVPKGQIETKILRTAQYRHLLKNRIEVGKRQQHVYQLQKEDVQFVYDPVKQAYHIKKHE